MESEFWLDVWERDHTPFHRSEANAALVAQFDALALTPGNRIFIPLCGKSKDISWLRDQGYAVAGAELSPLAITQLFEELGLTPIISEAGGLKRYSSDGLDIYVGDIFELEAKELGPVDAFYDRAALIALPPEMRKQYAAHLTLITNRAKCLLISLNYDQSKMDGPPFSVSETEIRNLYGNDYKVTCLERTEVPDGIKGITPGDETVWLLR